MFILRAGSSANDMVYCNFTQDIPDDIGTVSFHAISKCRLFFADVLTYPNYFTDFLV